MTQDHHLGRASNQASNLTVKEALDLQVSHAQAEHGQFVQAAADLLSKGQQAGELVQLPVETVSVALGRVGLDAIGSRRFWAGETRKRTGLSNLRDYRG